MTPIFRPWVRNQCIVVGIFLLGFFMLEWWELDLGTWQLANEKTLLVLGVCLLAVVSCMLVLGRFLLAKLGSCLLDLGSFLLDLGIFQLERGGCLLGHRSYHLGLDRCWLLVFDI